MGDELLISPVAGIQYLPTAARVRPSSVAHVTTHELTSSWTRNDGSEQSSNSRTRTTESTSTPMDIGEPSAVKPGSQEPLRMHPARLRNMRRSNPEEQHSFPPELGRREQKKFRGYKAKERKHVWNGVRCQLKGEEGPFFVKQTKGWGKGEKDGLLKRWDVEVKRRRDGRKAAVRHEAVQKDKTRREMGECLEMMEGLGMQEQD